MSGDYTGYFCASNFNGATISKFAQKVRDDETRPVGASRLNRWMIASSVFAINAAERVLMEAMLLDASQHPEQHLPNGYSGDDLDWR